MTRSAAEQEKVLDFMGRPEAYASRPAEIERIETHASYVFLAGPDAYKIKRAVKYAFLDFSTLEKRRLACLNELAINRRAAPRLYLEVVPITYGKNGVFRISGEGIPVEWAVHMRRFDQAKLYDRMAAEGRLPLAAMAPLGREIARFHAGADRFLKAGLGVDSLLTVLHDNEAAFASDAALFAPESVRELSHAARRGLAALAPLLKERALNGFVRHCHGDLHLRNIVEIEGAPVLFDAIEFDDAIATVDVLHDLAFLLMDLGARALTGHANAVLNAYLDADAHTANLLGLKALPLFLSLRAMVRAKVELLRARRSTDASDAGVRASAYFALAMDHLRTRAPRLIAIGGLSGSGKSTVARMLAPRIGSFPGAVHVRSDVERKRLFGVSADTALPEAAYTPELTEIVYATCRKRARLALEGGQTVIVDAVHALAAERDRIAAIAAEAGVAFAGLWLEAPRAVLRERVMRRKADVSDATTAIVDRQLAYDIGRQDFAVIDASRPLEQVVRSCLARIGEVAPQGWLKRAEPNG
jgi:aminoglycoside phosphotransferase family enzyme/predicted kinase